MEVMAISSECTKWILERQVKFLSPHKADSCSDKLSTDEQNSHKYFEWLGTRLGYKQMESWYQVTFDQIVKNHGGGLLKHFDNSPYLALKVSCPL